MDGVACKRQGWLLTVLFLGISCGQETQQPQTNTGPAQIEPPVQEEPALQLSPNIDLSQAIEDLALDAQGELLVSTGSQLYQMAAGQLSVRPLYAEPQEPQTMGKILAMSPLADGGAWVAAEEGLYTLQSLYLTASSLKLDGPVRKLLTIKLGPTAGLWLATDSGLHWLSQDNQLKALAMGKLSQGITALAADQRGQMLLQRGSEVSWVKLESGKLFDHPLGFPIGEVTAVASAGQTLLLQTQTHLYLHLYEPSERWVEVKLPQSTWLPLRYISGDQLAGRFWAQTLGGDLLEFDAQQIIKRPGLNLHVPPVVDGLGRIYKAGGSILLSGSVSSGPELSFEKDIRPWLQTHCLACHSSQGADFSAYETFRPLAEDALHRVKNGDMPRCEGSARCADEQQLKPENYQILLRWLREGRKP